jgi:hypothetical protein
VNSFVSLGELLAAIDVISCPGNCCVRHNVHGQCRDISGPDDTPNRQGPSELRSSGLKVVAKQGGRERGIHETGGDEIDSYRGNLKCEGRRKGREGRGCGRNNARTAADTTTTRAADKEKCSASPHPSDCVTGHLERQHDVVA